jgi:hypothetical protein
MPYLLNAAFFFLRGHVGMEQLATRFKPLQESKVSANGVSVANFIWKHWPDRYNLYSALGDTLALNPEVIKDTFRVIDTNNGRVERLEEASSAISKGLKYLTKSGQVMLTPGDLRTINAHMDGVKLTPSGKVDDIMTKINELLDSGKLSADKRNKVIEFVKTQAQHTTAEIDKIETLDEMLGKSKTTNELKQILRSLQKQAGGMQPTIFDPYFKKMEEKDPDLDLEVDGDPYVSPDVRNITLNDRIIFVALTFIVRSICVFLVEWAVSSEMTTTFRDAFTQYVTLYILIMVFLTFVVSTNSVGVQMLLYYMDTEANGYARIILHLSVIMMLVPMMYVIKEQSLDAIVGKMTFETKKRISQAVSGFTFIIWLLTTLIALRF